MLKKRQEDKDVHSAPPDKEYENSKENSESPFYKWKCDYEGAWPKLQPKFEGKSFPAKVLCYNFQLLLTLSFLV